MSTFPVICKCGYQLQDTLETPCPKCGGIERRVEMAARGTGMAKGSARMTRRKMDVEIKKNWPVLVVLFICNLVSLIPSASGGLGGILLSLFFIVVSSVLGYVGLTKVITITTLD